MPIGTGLPSPAILLCNRPIIALLPKLIGTHQFWSSQWKLWGPKTWQDKYLKELYTCRDSISLPVESMVSL